MPVKQVVTDVFEQLGSQAKHTTQTVKQEPGRMVRSLLGQTAEPDPAEAGGSQGQMAQQLQQQAQLARWRRRDEMKKQAALVAIRQHGQRLKEWEMERRRREAQQQQAIAAQTQQETKERQEKRQIKQLQKREKTEVLSVKRAQTAVEARLGKF